MIVALSVVGGFKASIREKLYAFEGHIHIHQYGLNTFQTASMPPIQMDSVLEKKITGVPGVTHIAPFIKRAGILQFDGKMEGLMFKGVPENFHFSQSISFSGNKIDYSDTAYSKDILLSRATADRLELKVGDMAQIYFLEEGSTFPRIRKVRLAGIFHTAMEEVDRANALCDIRLLRNINSWEEGDISAYQLSLADDKQSEKIADKILEEYLVSPLYSFTMEDLCPRFCLAENDGCECLHYSYNHGHSGDHQSCSCPGDTDSRTSPHGRCAEGPGHDYWTNAQCIFILCRPYSRHRRFCR